MKDTNINEYDLIFILVGSIIGTGILKLPYDICIIAKQDGWISVIIGGIYPIYFIFLSNIYVKKFPNNNLLELSKIFYGRYIGTFFNLIFLCILIFFTLIITNNFQILINTFIADFLTPIRIYIIVIILAVYVTIKGLNVLAQINKITFVLTILLLLISMGAFKYGNYLNLMPVLDVKITDIIKSVKSSLLVYQGFELILLYYPYVKNKNKIKKSMITTTIIIICIYTYVVFISIYFLGIDIIPHIEWPFISVTESINTPIVNNFRYIFMFLWILIILKSVTDIFYAVNIVSNSLFKISNKKLCILLGCFIICLLFGLKKILMDSQIVKNIIQIFIIYILLYSTGIIVMSLLKNKKHDAKLGENK